MNVALVGADVRLEPVQFDREPVGVRIGSPELTDRPVPWS